MTPDQIKALRERLGLSARAFAELLGMGDDSRAIRYFESGERAPSGPILRLMEMADRGELPKRYFPQPVKRGRKPKVSSTG